MDDVCLDVSRPSSIDVLIWGGCIGIWYVTVTVILT